MKVLDGVQFFDAEQQFLKLYEYEHEHEQQKKLTASALVTYLLMRSLCDGEGHILEDGFNLKAQCGKWNLPYSSIHNGYHRLFEIGLLNVVRIGEHTYIELPIVSAHIPNKDNYEVSSYFRFPKAIFQGSILRTFIKSRDVRGLLGLLDILNGLFREWSRKRSTTLKRKKETLMKKIKQSKYAFKNWLQYVLKGKNNVVEIYNENEDLFEIKLSEAAFVEREKDEEFEKYNAAIKNTLLTFIKESSMKFTPKDIQDMQFACQQELTRPMYRAIQELPQAEAPTKMIVPSILIATISKLEIDEPDVIGAYFRKTLRIQIRTALRDEKPLRILIANTYRDENLSVPEAYL